MAVKKEAVKTVPVKKAAAKTTAEKPAAKTTATKTVTATKAVPKPELKQFLVEIEKRAYELYLERQKNGITGDEMSDWLKAEKEVKNKYRL